MLRVCWHGQEFVELVRQERMLEAIAYSRQHLSPWSDLYQADLQRALAALAFRAGVLLPHHLAACASVACLASENSCACPLPVEVHAQLLQSVCPTAGRVVTPDLPQRDATESRKFLLSDLHGKGQAQ